MISPPLPSPAPSAWTKRWAIGNAHAELASVLEEIDACLAALAIDPATRIELSVALREALANAIQHGNLGVPSELREHDAAAFDRLVEARRAESPWAERRVRVKLAMRDGDLSCVVADEGDGFDPTVVPDPTEPENLTRITGRGLFVIRSCMDEVVHENGGRTLVMRKHLG